MMLGLAIGAAVIAVVPAVVFTLNLRHFRQPPDPEGRGRTPVSVLIPARDEEEAIAAAVRAALSGQGVDLEVIVLDDASRDRTADIVGQIAAEDGRVRLEHAPPLPPGWCGKQHACHVLSRLASFETLAFLDADVRLAPRALACGAEFMRRSGADLVSGFPRQITETAAETLVIPLIHFILLGFLPLQIMRRSGHPAFAAGIGQWFMTRRKAYLCSGGHEAIKSSRHDGVTLPRAFRKAGLKTDLFDATDLAECRMYRGLRALWTGLAKNATEGLASPVNLPIFTILLGLGHVAPPFILALSLGTGRFAAAAASLLAFLLSLWPRLAAAARLRQSFAGALLHPAAVALLLAIQWFAFARRVAGRPISWKGRR